MALADTTGVAGPSGSMCNRIREGRGNPGDDESESVELRTEFARQRPNSAAAVSCPPLPRRR